MNREILFRGKRADNGEWIEGYYCGKYNKTFFSPAEDSAQIIDKDLWWHEVTSETVGQYTGLTDKNGKKIFEGDILGRRAENGRMINEGEVKYGAFNCSCCSGVYGWYFECGDIRLLEGDTDLEVIGSIHDDNERVGAR